jgi:hypothetical protein
MDRTSLSEPLAHIREELASVPVVKIADGAGHGGEGYAGGWINGFSNMRVYLRRPGKAEAETDVRERYPAILRAVEQLRVLRGHRALRQIMVNVLEPGGELRAHRDGLPDDWRYHLPVFTNEHVMWWDELNGAVHMDEGAWHGPVPYVGVLHAVVNNGIMSRIHIVVDFAKSV